jgi:hypothetical protein
MEKVREKVEEVFGDEASSPKVVLSYSIEERPHLFALYKGPIGTHESHSEGFHIRRHSAQEVRKGVEFRDLDICEPFLEGEFEMGDQREIFFAQSLLYHTPVSLEAKQYLAQRSLVLFEKSKRDLAHARYTCAAIYERNMTPLENLVFDLDQPSDVKIRSYPLGPMMYSLLYMAAKERYDVSSEPISMKQMLQVPRTDIELQAQALNMILSEEDAYLSMGDAQLFFSETRNLLRKRFKL